MEEVLLSIIALSGLCAVSSHAERHYHFVYDPKTWTEAQRYCRENYTDLATIDNMEDVRTVDNMADTSKLTDSYLWIGLYDDVDSWKWSLSDTSFYKHGETEFRQWAPGEPNSPNSGQYCTSMGDDGQWTDNSCNVVFKAVCSYVRGSDVTFILINKTMTWAEAQSYCRANYTDLTSVRNMAENQNVQELVPAGERVWIGLFRDSWKWSDGSSSSFRHWAPGELDNDGGDQQCVTADVAYSGQWRNLYCDNNRAFICYSTSVGENTTQQTTTQQATTQQTRTEQATTKQATNQATTQQVFRLKFQTQDSSVDLNDPAVMEGILKKLKQKLKDQGLDDNIKVSWRKQPDGKVFHKEEKKKKTKKDEL